MNKHTKIFLSAFLWSGSTPLLAQYDAPDGAVELCGISLASSGVRFDVKGNLFVVAANANGETGFYSAQYPGDGIEPTMSHYVPVSGDWGSVAFTNNFLIYTTWNAYEPGGNRTGVVVVYELGAASDDLTESARLYPLSPDDNSSSGASALLDTDAQQFVVANNFSTSNSSFSRVYIYSFDGTSWSLEDYIDRPGFISAKALAIDGDLLAIGYDDGTVHLYEREINGWVYVQAISPILDPEITTWHFPYSIDISGNMIAIGDNSAIYRPTDPSEGGGIGACYIYTYGSSGVSDVGILFEYDGSPHNPSGFAEAVDFSDDGSALAVGAPSYDRVALSYESEGAVFVYDTSDYFSGSTRYTDKNHDQAGDSLFGHGVKFSGSILAAFNFAINDTVYGACGSGLFETGISLFNALDIPPCADADIAIPYGQINFFDLSEFIAAYGSQSPLGDWNSDGVYNYFDISAYLTDYHAGCP